jgi:hypothetical protein
MVVSDGVIFSGPTRAVILREGLPDAGGSETRLALFLPKNGWRSNASPGSQPLIKLAVNQRQFLSSAGLPPCPASGCVVHSNTNGDHRDGYPVDEECENDCKRYWS